MITDKNLRVSDAQALAGAGTTVSTNSIDLGLARDIGEGTELIWHITTVASASGLATAVAFQAIGATDAALTTGIVVLGSSDAIAIAALDADAANTGLGNATPIVVRINPQLWSTGLRYIGVRYVPSGGTVSGTWTADLVMDYQGGRKFYPSGFTIA